MIICIYELITILSYNNHLIYNHIFENMIIIQYNIYGYYILNAKRQNDNKIK